MGRSVFLVQLVQPARRQPAGRDLGAQIAHRGFGESNVVSDHPVKRLVERAGVVELELVELQPLQPRVDDPRSAAEAGAAAADIDPVRPHHGEEGEPVLEEIGDVDDDVVEVLARDRLVIGDQHVARREPVPAVPRHCVGNDDAEIRNEVGYAAHVLTHQPAVDVDDGGTEIPHLVNHHVVRGPLEVDRHLVGDRRKGVADDFEGHGIERLVHRDVPTVTINSPVPAISHRSPSKSTVVEACSWISAGPPKALPAARVSRR